MAKKEGGTRRFERLRALCLAYPEASETASWGHPNFKAGKKDVRRLRAHQGPPSIAFRLEPSDVERLLTRRQFFVTPYGRGQWVSLWADGAMDWKAVTDLVDRSYRLVAQKRMIAILDAVNGTLRNYQKSGNFQLPAPKSPVLEVGFWDLGLPPMPFSFSP